MGAYCARIPLHVGRQVREDRLSSRRPPTRAAILQDDQFDGGAQLARPLECFPISGLAHGAAAPSGSGCGVFGGVPNIVTYCSGRLLPHCVLCIRFLTEQPHAGGALSLNHCRAGGGFGGSPVPSLNLRFTGSQQFTAACVNGVNIVDRERFTGSHTL